MTDGCRPNEIGGLRAGQLWWGAVIPPFCISGSRAAELRVGVPLPTAQPQPPAVDVWTTTGKGCVRLLGGGEKDGTTTAKGARGFSEGTGGVARGRIWEDSLLSTLGWRRPAACGVLLTVEGVDAPGISAPRLL